MECYQHHYGPWSNKADEENPYEEVDGKNNEATQLSVYSFLRIHSFAYNAAWTKDGVIIASWLEARVGVEPEIENPGRAGQLKRKIIANRVF